ncbi:MAG: peptidoglycan DD-metalloendopeptidase family protein, partial [Methylophaga sp.]|nr:peptidoglycan DD-metalloendopeptidase family protein [Methylophaga sp.]
AFLREQEKSLHSLFDSLSKPAKVNTNKTVSAPPSFAKRAGSLAWPIKGKVLARYGSSRNLGKLTWQGILISTPAGKNIVASAPGRVVFADWLRGFGLLVIIDHGDQYMTLYGNNETLLTKVGDSVSTGDWIAQSGDKGIHQHAGLYFEIRHKGSPTNPLKWLGKKG